MDKNREIIITVFKGRCILCRRQTSVIHEIVPKSMRKDWDTLDNRVPLCNKCHLTVHTNGAMNMSSFLETERDKVLIQYYGQSDINNIYERI